MPHPAPIDCNLKLKKRIETNKIQFYLVFSSFVPIFLVLRESFIRCYLLELSSYYAKWIFSAFVVCIYIYINRHRNLLPSALAFSLTKLKLNLSATTNTQWFVDFFYFRYKIRMDVTIAHAKSVCIVTFAFNSKMSSSLWNFVVHFYTQ